MHAHMCTHTHSRVHTHTHIHTHTHTRTYTHAHMHTHNRFTPATDDCGLPLKHTEAVDRLKPSLPKRRVGKDDTSLVQSTILVDASNLQMKLSQTVNVLYYPMML